MKDSVSEPKRDSLWRKTPYRNLVRYTPSGMYYARVRIKGKLKRKSLKTTSLDVAHRKLRDFEKDERDREDRLNGNKVEKMTFGDALELLRQNRFRPLTPTKKKDLVTLKPKALAYYEQRAKALPKFWPKPKLFDTPIPEISRQDVIAWSSAFRASRSATAHNHTLGLLRNVFAIAVERGVIYRNPCETVLRATEKPKKMILPTREQFEDFVAAIERNGVGKLRHCANLVRFLAYGGFRLGEAANITWADCDFDKEQIRVVGDPETGTKGTEEKIRFVPMIGHMREFLEGLRTGNEPPESKVMRISECQKAMDRAAMVVGMARITHHDLRHVFTTRCIESGVSIPVISKWLGHADGGALCMRVYGHIIDEHSRREAKKVSFSSKRPANVVELNREAVNE